MTVEQQLVDLVGESGLVTGNAVSADYGHDEALSLEPCPPRYVVRPETAEQVAGVLRVASEHRIPVTARGSATGLSGAARPRPDGMVVSFERMNRVLEIDTENHVAVVQPGVTLAQLDEQTARAGLVYPVFPGENSASLGGNVATNAGGMRAVRYGVTRQHVVGVEAVLPTGEVIRSGGRLTKTSSGYDLTQLLVGSEGTLALVTEATLRLYPRAEHMATVLAPFGSLEEVTRAVPRIIASGIGPLILEYIDAFTMVAITSSANLDLGVPEQVRESASAYLVVLLENRSQERLDADVESLAEHLGTLGATDSYVLPAGSARRLVEAREKAFWVAKAAGAHDIVDVVVPRSAMPDFLAEASRVAQEHEGFVAGCGHAGDGNVHLSVFQPDAERRTALLRDLFRAGMALGGAISGEHGLGTAKKKYFLELEDPVKIDLMRRIKAAFDPQGILNPDVLLDAAIKVETAKEGS